MNIKLTRSITIVLLCVSALASGCAKKQIAATPAPTPPAPTPAPTKFEPPPPAPMPTIEAPQVTKIGSGDLQPAFFDLDSYTLREDARASLDKDAKLLRDHPNVTITVEGHCDERGTTEYNQALGEKRAQAARDYLVGAGIAAARVEIISYGKEKPFAQGHDESAWQQNRRAHLVVRTGT
ncbi:MAG: peptidoglycan-associated lipoprotein Pal [Candidatus Eisenbacteria bacterium]|uniref:Peptidoglycan-associated lipoprotein n=1 Tax=Eiseniibacteriota bacterium TaxID=2212470 RepID=A0A9D6QIX4_UNCEI|nr:peptidoglycan-associated lipoprotein Pal [Candidatus Eisenbacteria bacterium]MBI3539917.1 peptidoglycan-associated lipoprotein Pal [Candidatus Eisenbacteria bacterium]